MSQCEAEYLSVRQDASAHEENRFFYILLGQQEPPTQSSELCPIVIERGLSSGLE